MTDELTGRCLCGAVNYKTKGLPLRVSHCYCEQCRRSGGGVALTLATFNTDQVTFSGIATKEVRPTDFATRSFCPECGSHITFQFDDKPDFIAIMVSTLDQPEKAPAIRHNFASEKITWVHLDEHLPMPTGARAKVHCHDKIETIAYLLEGTCAVYYGDQMEHRTLLETGDQIFIPADVPHAPCNESNAPCTWIVVLSSASDQDGIVLLPGLDRVLEERSSPT